MGLPISGCATRHRPRLPSVEVGADLHILQRRGQDRALHREHATRLAQGVLERAGNAGHRQHEEIAERVSPSGEPSPKRYWNSRAISGSTSDSATMLLRKSPGGRMPCSRRKRPDEPPSSPTVTIAVMFAE